MKTIAEKEGSTGEEVPPAGSDNGRPPVLPVEFSILRKTMHELVDSMDILQLKLYFGLAFGISETIEMQQLTEVMIKFGTLEKRQDSLEANVEKRQDSLETNVEKKLAGFLETIGKWRYGIIAAAGIATAALGAANLNEVIPVVQEIIKAIL